MKKRHVDWQQFLCGTAANDYIFQNEPYEMQIKKAAELIQNAEAVLIGAGAGLSTAAGFSVKKAVITKCMMQKKCLRR